MSHPRTMTEERHKRAAHAVDLLAPARSDHQLLSVQCARAHHLAAVYETSVGPVVVSRTGPHSHGSKDRIDTGHHGSASGAELVDLLDVPEAEDALPAWCDCGPRTLSRTALLAHLRDGTRTVHLG